MWPETVREGLRLINQGAYYEAHEALEEAWRAEARPIRELYQGLLQAAVVAYHIQQANWRGAIKVYHRAMRHLRPWPDRVHDIDVAAVRAQLERLAHLARQALRGQPPARWPEPLLHVPGPEDASEPSGG